MSHRTTTTTRFTAPSVTSASASSSGLHTGGFVVAPRALLERLLRHVDVGRDGRITAADLRQARVKSLTLRLSPGVEVTLSGAERLSHFAALLGAEVRKGNGDRAVLPVAALAPSRLDAVRSYVAHSWDVLTRRADDVATMTRAIDDGLQRAADGRYYLYVPVGDPAALARLTREARRVRGKEIIVAPVPVRRGAGWRRRLEEQAGIAYLPRPYLVPGGMFAEMYGWDSYFQAMGALADGRLDLARDVCENLAYQLRHYGRIANTNRSYHLSRSHPPLFTPLLRTVHSELERRGDPTADDFLRRGVRAAEHTLERVWGLPPRTTEIGLGRYHDDGTGPCPEVPRAFYEGRPATPAHFAHDRALRESGWDLTHRFGDDAHLAVPVCLNALLYRTERDLAAMLRRLEGGGSRRAARWDRRALARRKLVDHYLWDERRGMYFDWSLRRRARNSYESLATFFPLWVGMASGQQAARVAEHVERFLAPGGLAASSEGSRRTAPRERFQWDWPIGWAPLQIVAVEGLRRYGYQALADRIAYRWLWMVLRIAGDGNGVIMEKYDVVARTACVSAAEYANQGSDRGAYLDTNAARTVGFGWTNASIPLLLAGLEEPLLAKLDAGVRPRDAGV